MSRRRVDDLSSAGRRARVVGGIVVALGLLAGTAWGDDDHFPFGPMRMYSTTNDVDGTIDTVRFRAVDETGRELAPRPQDFALRPAEINGQTARFRQDPELLSRLVDSYRRLYPGRPPLIELELYYGVYRLENGRPIDFFEEDIATWER